MVGRDGGTTAGLADLVERTTFEAFLLESRDVPVEKISSLGIEEASEDTVWVFKSRPLPRLPLMDDVAGDMRLRLERRGCDALERGLILRSLGSG